MHHRLALLLSLCLALAAPLRAEPVQLYAASSLKDALDAVIADWSGGEVRPIYAASSTIARQVAAGAPADLIITASTDWMDWLAAQSAIEPTTRSDLLANRLVLIGPSSAPPAKLDLTLAERLGQGPLAMALTEAVPAGQYGRAALEALGLWEALSPRVVQTANVRAALALVALGEAPLGIVYATDALIEPRVSVLATFPSTTHAPIRYPMALTPNATDAATALYTFLTGGAAQARFASAGFAPVEGGR